MEYLVLYRTVRLVPTGLQNIVLLQIMCIGSLSVSII